MVTEDFAGQDCSLTKASIWRCCFGDGSGEGAGELGGGGYLSFILSIVSNYHQRKNKDCIPSKK